MKPQYRVVPWEGLWRQARFMVIQVTFTPLGLNLPLRAAHRFLAELFSGLLPARARKP